MELTQVQAAPPVGASRQPLDNLLPIAMLAASTVASPVARRPAELIAVGAVCLVAVRQLRLVDRVWLRRMIVHLGVLVAVSVWLVARVEPPWGGGRHTFMRPTFYPVTLLDYLPFLWGFLILATRTFTARDLRVYLWAIVVTVPIHAAVVIVQARLGSPARWGWEIAGWPAIELNVRPRRHGRATGVFGNGNHLAVAALYGMVAAAALLHTGRSPRHRRLRSAVLATALAASILLLISSGSRVTWAVAAAIVAGYALVLAPRFRGIVIGALAVTGVLVVLSVNDLGPATRAARTVVPDVVWGRITLASGDLSWRLDVWECGLDLIAERPIVGWGLGTFAPECEQRWPEMFPDRTMITDGGINHAHNLVVQMASELGIPFTLVVSGWLVRMGARALAGLGRAPPSAERSLRVGSFTVVVGALVVSQINLSVAHDTGLAVIFWVCAALFVAPVGGAALTRRRGD